MSAAPETTSSKRVSQTQGGKLFNSIKTMGRLDTIKDDRGFEVVVQAREDSEQTQKHREIVDLLVAAGYFRARVQGLSPFDQVVGGLVWCITICNFNVDVDILFQENSNVGDKIALVEKIVAVLPRMKCPHSIQPHEIQGFNYIAIFPVVQWLVRQVILYRAERGDQNRVQSMFNFSKKFHLAPSENKQVALGGQANVGSLRKESLPVRKFKRASNKRLKSDQALIQCTLLEFGKKGDILQLISEGANEGQAALTVDQMMGAMASSGGSSGYGGSKGTLKVSSETVGSLLSEKLDQVAQLQAEFDVRKQEAENSPAQQHARQVANLKSRIAETEKMLMAKAEVYQQLNDEFKLRKAELISLQEKVDDFDGKIGELRSLETDENKETLEKLQCLVKQHEEVKTKESTFKAGCKEQMEKLTEEVVSLRSVLDSVVKGSSESVPEDFKTEHEDLTNRVGKAEALIGRKMREIGDYQRKLDDIPSRAELSQYQKRFVELYNQICFKYTETKHHFTLYNTLSDTKAYMEKEITLLNSIHDEYEVAMKGNADMKKQFLARIEQATESTGLTKDRVMQTKLNAKKTRDALNAQMMDLLEKQRQYHLTVKELQQEFKSQQ